MAFSDCQKLHILKTKLQRLSLVLDSCLDISSGLDSRFEEDSFPRLSPRSELVGTKKLMADLELYSVRLRLHKKTVTSMMNRVSSTNRLMFKILEFRNDESLSSASHDTQTNISILRQTAFQTQQESASLSALAVQGQKEARSLKALSMMATTYLPASLIATIFSSTLIQPQDTGDGHGVTSFMVSSKFWIYVLASLSLTACTFLSTHLLERWLQRRHKMN